MKTQTFKTSEKNGLLNKIVYNSAESLGMGQMVCSVNPEIHLKEAYIKHVWLKKIKNNYHL